MDKLKSVLVVCSLILSTQVLDFPQAYSSAQKIVTAAQVNGTWESKTGAFKVLALGKQRLRVEFHVEYGHGASVNVGDGSGIAFIEGDTAILKPEESGDECKIIMKFIGGKLKVEQKGECGFGLNVDVSGIYKKIST